MTELAKFVQTKPLSLVQTEQKSAIAQAEGCQTDGENHWK
jgi:hypothetical protein